MTRVGRASGSNGWLWCALLGHRRPSELHATVTAGKADLFWRCPRCKVRQEPVGYDALEDE